MEERMLDDEEGRRIRLARTEDGGVDAVEGEGEDLLYDFGGEDLAGLSPEERQAELERRERERKAAAEQFGSLLKEGEERLASSDFEGAAERFEQALLYDTESEPAQIGLWKSLTHGFSDFEPLLSDGNAERISEMPAAKERVMEEMGDRLRGALSEAKEEEEKLRPSVEGARRERREAFFANRSYYAKRTFVLFCVAVLFAIATAISGNSILRTQSVVPIVLTAVFAVLTAAGVVMLIYYFGKLYAALRLCRENEKPDSTESGAKLEYLQNRIALLEQLLK